MITYVCIRQDETTGEVEYTVRYACGRVLIGGVEHMPSSVFRFCETHDCREGYHGSLIYE